MKKNQNDKFEDCFKRCKKCNIYMQSKYNRINQFEGRIFGKNSKGFGFVEWAEIYYLIVLLLYIALLTTSYEDWMNSAQ